MTLNLKQLATSVAFAATLLAMPGLANADTIQGMIVSRDGSRLLVRIGNVDTAVTLTGGTKIQAIKGVLGAQREDYPPEDLINGLAVNIDTVQNGDELTATSVTFKPSDLKTAQAIQAGVAQAKSRIIAQQAENNRRFSQVGQFTEKGKVRVYFATGSAAINAKGAQDLQDFARQAASTPGYLLRVVGNTDSTGNASANQRLSNQRASAVTAYLLRNCNVPSTKIAGATGLGAYVPIDDDSTSAGQAQNRRATVFLLVSKASEPGQAAAN